MIAINRELDIQTAKSLGWRQVSEGEPYFWPTAEMVNRIREVHPDVLAVDYFLAPEFSTDVGQIWFLLQALFEDRWRVEFDEDGIGFSRNVNDEEGSLSYFDEEYFVARSLSDRLGIICRMVIQIKKGDS